VLEKHLGLNILCPLGNIIYKPILPSPAAVSGPLLLITVSWLTASTRDPPLPRGEPRVPDVFVWTDRQIGHTSKGIQRCRALTQSQHSPLQ